MEFLRSRNALWRPSKGYLRAEREAEEQIRNGTDFVRQ